jgi:hypothetical protein
MRYSFFYGAVYPCCYIFVGRVLIKLWRDAGSDTYYLEGPGPFSMGNENVTQLRVGRSSITGKAKAGRVVLYISRPTPIKLYVVDITEGGRVCYSYQVSSLEECCI